MWLQYCQTASSAPRAAADPRKRLHQIAGVIGIAPDAEPEDDLALLPVGQIEGYLDRGAGIQGGPHLAGKARARHRRRTSQRAVASEEFGPVAAYGAGRIVHVEERDPVGELRVVRIARKQRAAVRVDFGDHVHGRFRPQIAQHPFHVAGGGEPARPARLVAHFQHRELDRRIQGHVDPQLRADAALGVLEDAVAESVPADVRRRSAAGQRRGRPEMAALFVAQVKRLSARIADRIVVPGREAELVGVLAPGVGQAALRDDGAEMRVGQHIHPRRRRHLPGAVVMTYSRPSGVNPPSPLKKIRSRRGNAATARGSARWVRVGVRRGTAASTRLRRLICSASGPRLSVMMTRATVWNRMRSSSDICSAGSHEDAARPVDHIGFDARGDQPHDLVLQQLPVTGAIFVPDHQVHRQSLQTPVGVGLHELAHQFDIGRIADLQQHDRQIAGDGIAPQAGLPAAVLA